MSYMHRWIKYIIFNALCKPDKRLNEKWQNQQVKSRKGLKENATKEKITIFRVLLSMEHWKKSQHSSLQTHWMNDPLSAEQG